MHENCRAAGAGNSQHSVSQAEFMEWKESKHFKSLTSIGSRSSLEMLTLIHFPEMLPNLVTIIFSVFIANYTAIQIEKSLLRSSIYIGNTVKIVNSLLI